MTFIILGGIALAVSLVALGMFIADFWQKEYPEEMFWFPIEDNRV